MNAPEQRANIGRTIATAEREWPQATKGLSHVKRTQWASEVLAEINKVRNLCAAGEDGPSGWTDSDFARLTSVVEQILERTTPAVVTISLTDDAEFDLKRFRNLRSDVMLGIRDAAGTA